MTLSLRTIGGRDYTIFDDGLRVGRIRYARERSPAVWIWSVLIHIPAPGGLPMGTTTSLDAAKADFTVAWSSFKSRQTPETLATAYEAADRRAES